jgi:hypothetical protein
MRLVQVRAPGRVVGAVDGVEEHLLDLLDACSDAPAAPAAGQLVVGQRRAGLRAVMSAEAT